MEAYHQCNSSLIPDGHFGPRCDICQTPIPTPTKGTRHSFRFDGYENPFGPNPDNLSPEDNLPHFELVLQRGDTTKCLLELTLQRQNTSGDLLESGLNKRMCTLL
jgi:hypothetical protein